MNSAKTAFRAIAKLFTCMVCLFALATSAYAVTPQAGWWWNPDEGGRGYAIEVQNNTVFFGAYMYDGSGQATWYVVCSEQFPSRCFN